MFVYSHHFRSEFHQAVSSLCCYFGHIQSHLQQAEVPCYTELNLVVIVLCIRKILWDDIESCCMQNKRRVAESGKETIAQHRQHRLEVRLRFNAGSGSRGKNMRRDAFAIPPFKAHFTIFTSLWYLTSRLLDVLRSSNQALRHSPSRPPNQSEIATHILTVGEGFGDVSFSWYAG